MNGAEHEAVSFERFEALSKHLFADPFDAACQLAEPMCAFEQIQHNQRSPAGRDVFENDAGRARCVRQVAAPPAKARGQNL